MNILKPNGDLKDSLVRKFLNKAYDRVLPPEFYARYGSYPPMRIVGINGRNIMLLMLPHNTIVRSSGASISAFTGWTLCSKYKPKDSDRFQTSNIDVGIINHVLNKKKP